MKKLGKSLLKNLVVTGCLLFASSSQAGTIAPPDKLGRPVDLQFEAEPNEQAEFPLQNFVHLQQFQEIRISEERPKVVTLYGPPQAYLSGKDRKDLENYRLASDRLEIQCDSKEDAKILKEILQRSMRYRLHGDHVVTKYRMGSPTTFKAHVSELKIEDLSYIPDVVERPSAGKPLGNTMTLAEKIALNKELLRKEKKRAKKAQDGPSVWDRMIRSLKSTFASTATVRRLGEVGQMASAGASSAARRKSYPDPHSSEAGTRARLGVLSQSAGSF